MEPRASAIEDVSGQQMKSLFLICFVLMFDLSQQLLERCASTKSRDGRDLSTFSKFYWKYACARL